MAVTSTTVWGRWQCTRCGQAEISGRETRCPSCGDPRERDELAAMRTPGAAVFEREAITDPEELRLAHAGADWSCPYCGSGNRAVEGRCVSCGARVDERAAGGGRAKRRRRGRAPRTRPSGALDLSGLGGGMASARPEKRRTGLLVGIAAVGALVGGTVVAVSGGAPRRESLEAEVSRLEWATTTRLEAWREVKRSDWRRVHPRAGKPPVKGAGEVATIKDVSCEERERGEESYRCGFENYTAVQTYSCGATSKCTTRNNANGSFTRTCTSVPQTCTRNVQQTRPKYCTRPVYETWCEYVTEEWVKIDEKTDKGEGHGPYTIPTFDEVADDQRTETSSTYRITFTYGERSRHREEVEPRVYEGWELGDRAILNRVGFEIVGYRRPRAGE